MCVCVLFTLAIYVYMFTYLFIKYLLSDIVARTMRSIARPFGWLISVTRLQLHIHELSTAQHVAAIEREIAMYASSGMCVAAA